MLCESLKAAEYLNIRLASFNPDNISKKYIFHLVQPLPLVSSDPARKITVRKGLTDQETFERETASFEVELSHTDVEGTWQKDSIRVKPNNQWRVSTNGRVHSLTLSNLTMEDTGTIVFSAEGVRTTARLTIKGDQRRCMCPFFSI